MATETRNLKLVITEKGAKKTQSAVKGINSSLGGVTKSLAGMAVADVGISKAMAFMSDAVAIHEEYSTQMGIVALNTGESTPATDEFNKKLSVLTGTGITSIATTQAIISSYKGMNATIVKESIPAILDLSAQWGVDAPAAAKQLMKASSDLGSGLLALKKKGLDFTETQIAQMKAMEDAGDKAGVFKAILKQVEKQYKGTAEETANFTDQMKSASDILKESAGGKFLEGMGIEGADLAEQLLNLEPIIDNLAEGLGKLTKFLWDNKEAILAVGGTTVGGGLLGSMISGFRDLSLTVFGAGSVISSVSKKFQLMDIVQTKMMHNAVALKVAESALAETRKYYLPDIAEVNAEFHKQAATAQALTLENQKLSKSLGIFTPILTKMRDVWHSTTFHVKNSTKAIVAYTKAITLAKIATAGLLIGTGLLIAELFRRQAKDTAESVAYLNKARQDLLASSLGVTLDTITAQELRVLEIHKNTLAIKIREVEKSLANTRSSTVAQGHRQEVMELKTHLADIEAILAGVVHAPVIPDVTDAEVVLPFPKVSGIPGDMFTFEDDDFTPDIDVDLFRSDSEMMLLINNQTNQMIADGIDMLDEKKIKAHEDALARAEKEKEIIGDVVRDSLALFNDISTERVSALDREQQAMQETAEYQNATVEDKAAMDKEYNSKKKGILSTQFEVTRLARFAEMGMNTAEAIMEAAPNVPLQIAVGALGAAQGAFIMSQANPYRAALGADFETNGQMLMLVGDNPGGREHVTVTPTSSPNVRGGHGGDLALIEEVRALRVELSTIQRYNIRTIDAVEMSMINEEGGLQRGVI